MYLEEDERDYEFDHDSLLNPTEDKTMITGEIKNQIDQIWDTFWVGGITNSMSVLEQMTYLFFLKMLDDDQMKKEASTIILVDSISNPTFKDES